MDEAEWLSCTDPTGMLAFLQIHRRASDRKARLFAVACCRRIDAISNDSDIGDQRIGLSEGFADGAVSEATLRDVRNDLGARADYSSASAANNAIGAILHDDAWRGATAAADAAAQYFYYCVMERKTAGTQDLARELRVQKAMAVSDDVRAIQAVLLRDIFGNQFHECRFDMSWLAWNGGAIPKLAQSIYDDRELPSGHLKQSRLSVLADALEEAGCSDQDILGHLRGPGPHVRGCHVVDLILEKE